MMKIDEIFPYTFKGLAHELGYDRPKDTRPMWQRRLSTASEFCLALVACGYLSEEQMQRAARRYRLGVSRDGGVIFWQIDEHGVLRDGKIMHYRADCHRDHDRKPSWVNYHLRKSGCLPEGWKSEHCLFGLHLLGHTDLTDLKSHTEITESTEILRDRALQMRGHTEIAESTEMATPNNSSGESVCDFRDILRNRALQMRSHTEIAENTEMATPREIDGKNFCDSRDILRNRELQMRGHAESAESTEMTTPRGIDDNNFRDFCDFRVNKTVCVVEAEKTAVIMSEVKPGFIWLATGGKTELNVARLKPLAGHKVILFPDTDEDGQTYRDWYEIAEAATDVFGHPFTVSSILEQRATKAQKAAKIDIVDLLFNKS